MEKSKVARKYEQPRNEDNVQTQATPITVVATANVVVGITLNVNKEIAKDLFFSLERETESINDGIYQMERNIELSTDDSGRREMIAKREAMKQKIFHMYQVRNQILTALIGGDDNV